MPIDKVTAINLLRRHAFGEELPAVDHDAMLAGLYESMRRDPLVYQWANVRDGKNLVDARLHHSGYLTIQDVITGILEAIEERRWPKVGEGKGKVQTVTSQLLASEFRYRLRDAYRRGVTTGNYFGGDDVDGDVDHDVVNPQAELLLDHGPAPEAGLGGPGNPSEEDQASTPIEELYDGEMAETLAIARFEERCYLAARHLVLTFDPEFAQIVERLMAPYYLDEQDVDDKQVAAQLKMTTATFSRRLRALGLRLLGMQARQKAGSRQWMPGVRRRSDSTWCWAVG